MIGSKFFLTLFILMASVLKSFSFNASEVAKIDDFNSNRSCSHYRDKKKEQKIMKDNHGIRIAEDFSFFNEEYSDPLQQIKDYSNIGYEIKNNTNLVNNQIWVPQDLLFNDYSGYGCLQDFMIGYLVWRATVPATVLLCGGRPIAFYHIDQDIKNKKFSKAVAAVFSNFNPANDIIDFGQALVRCTSKLGWRGAAATMLVPLAIATGYFADGIEKMKSARKAAKQIVLCGHNWQLYGDTGNDNDVDNGKKKFSSEFKFDKISYNNVFHGYHSYLKEKTKETALEPREINELIYKGVERKNHDPDCIDVTKQGSEPQIYYFRGSEAAEYGCDKYHPRNHNPFLPGGHSKKKYEEAYACCIKYQTQSICLENLSKKFDDKSGEQKECDKNNKEDCYYQHCIEDENCEVKNIKGQRSHNSSSTGSRNLDIYYSDSDSSNTKICAKTNDLCPFNIPIALGVEKRDCHKYEDLSLADFISIADDITDNNIETAKTTCKKYETREWIDGKCKKTELLNQCQNYCAIDNHCVKITPAPKENKSEDYSVFFASACIDFQGDSKMKGALLAPLAQCFRESISNFFFNKAGRSTGNYFKGDTVIESSFLTKIQDLVKDSIRIAMVIAVILAGLGLLIGAGGRFDKRAIYFLVAKIALISYFALGDGWKEKFFESIYGTSTTFVSLTNSIIYSESENAIKLNINSLKNDGCYYHPGEYKKGSEYLAIWDTMDCKIHLYLGLGVSQWGIIGLIISSAVTGIWGMYLAISTLAFGIFVFILAANILYMFVFSSFLLVLLVFISPITITLSLFKATSGIFQDWLKELMSFALQPIILFFYMAFVIIMFDKFMIGDALFIKEQRLNQPYELLGDQKKCTTYGGDYSISSNKCTRQGKEISLPEDKEFCEEILGGKYNGQKCLDIFTPPSKRPYTPNCEPYSVDNNNKVVNNNNNTYREIIPKNTSPICVLQATPEGLALNLIIPIRALFSVIIGSDDSALKNKAITMLEVAIFMYIISMFTSAIPRIAADLTNGTPLKGVGFEITSIIKQGGDFASGASKRLSNSFKRPPEDDDKKDSGGGNALPAGGDKKDSVGENAIPREVEDNVNEGEHSVGSKSSADKKPPEGVAAGIYKNE